MTTEKRDVLVVIGAGAAGLWAAARAAELGRRVHLFEKTARAGTKVLASGGTRCNLTTTLPAAEAGRLFGTRAERFLRRALRELGPGDVRTRFHELGVPTVEAPLEKVFPKSDRARDVRDALLAWATASGVRIEYEAGLEGLEANEGGGYRLRFQGGETLAAREVLLCPGGQSYPRTGTTGDGYAWLRGLGLEVVPPVPALVPLTSPDAGIRELAGISLQEVEVRLVDAAGKRLGRRRRPVVFTHQGISGPGAMDLSGPVARAAGGLFLELELRPQAGFDELRDDLFALERLPGAPKLGRVLADRLELPRRLVACVLAQAGLAATLRVNELTRPGRHGLLEALRAFRIPLDGTLGFDRAEVTSGGLALNEVDPGTLAVRGHPGLHVFGELLDIDGPIGGLNFQAAFATADLAARAVATA